MMNKPYFCKLCPINHVTEGYVPLHIQEGSTLAVGEAAGEEEIKQGLPFVGGAGGWLSSMCRAARLSRNYISIVNTLGCRPPDNVYPTAPIWSKAVKNYFRKKLIET